MFKKYIKHIIKKFSRFLVRVVCTKKSKCKVICAKNMLTFSNKIIFRFILKFSDTLIKLFFPNGIFTKIVPHNINNIDFLFIQRINNC